MHITEMSKSTGATVDELRYMERKGFLASVSKLLKRRRVRNFRDSDIRKVKLIIKYRKQGFTWDTAFQKAEMDLESPQLFEDI